MAKTIGQIIDEAFKEIKNDPKTIIAAIANHKSDPEVRDLAVSLFSMRTSCPACMIKPAILTLAGLLWAARITKKEDVEVICKMIIAEVETIEAGYQADKKIEANYQ